MSIEIDIHNGINQAIENADIVNTAFPNMAFDGIDKPYLRVNIMPADTVSFGLSSLNIFEGIVQVDIVVDEGLGEMAALKIAASVKDVFPRNSYIKHNNTLIRFNKEGSVQKINNSINGRSHTQADQNSYTLFVVFPYISINR